MRINTSMTSAVIPGLAAGVIYLVIAFATGASAAASIIGGIAVAVVAVVIGLIFRAVYRRRAASRNSPQSPQ
jgi:membrane protein YdbS with pleckstrin-like domain